MADHKDEIFLIEFGKHLRALRKKHKHTQQSLAFRCDIDPGQLSRAERGITSLSMAKMQRISIALNISLSEVFAGLKNLELQ